MTQPQLSLAKDKVKILLLEGIHHKAVETFAKSGYHQVELLSHSLDPSNLKEKLANVHLLGIRSRTQLTEDVLAAANKLISVGCFCIGTNQVQLDAATEQGIPVFNAPFSNTRSVAELVLAEAILLMRGIPEKNQKAHRGVWIKSAKNSYEIRGKKLGIIGYGNIGSQISVMAEALGMDVYFYDVVPKLPLGNAEQVFSLKELMSDCDVVTLHVPETQSTRYMIGAKELGYMQPSSVLVNASRGTVVEIEALANAIKEEQLAGAAIDVFPTEPKSNDEIFESPLRGLDNVIITPHVGGSTMEAQENIGQEVAQKLALYSDNGTTLSSVNFPEVALPTHEGQHRLLHIHKNVPGILSQINQILSEDSVNIGAQYLQTNDKVGYVVTDLCAEHSKQTLAKLRAIEGTIKARILF